MDATLDKPEINFRHLLLCDEVQHNPLTPGKSYTLVGITNWLQPEVGFDYPLIVERLMVFAQYWGQRGEHRVRIDLYQVDIEDGNEAFVTTYGNLSLAVHGNDFVESRRWLLHQVLFEKHGLYEFRIFLDDEFDPIASERLLLREIFT